jgi:iron(III) transport system substrate-binding protein
MWAKSVAVAALAGAMAWASPGQAEPPAPYDITPELIDAAKKEGTVVFYTATDVTVAEKLAATFEQEYPGIKVQVERSGSERVFQRIGQEYSTGIYNADVIETSDAVHFILFKKEGWLTAAVPQVVATSWPAE